MGDAIADLDKARERIGSSRPRSGAPWVQFGPLAPAGHEPDSRASAVVDAPAAHGNAQGAMPLEAEPDFAAADALTEIRASQKRLREYRTRAQQLTGVEEVVSRKVLADYDARYQELERKASPLVHSVRHEHDRLRRIAAQVRRTDEEARLVKAEADLRHAVGEIDEAELAERSREPNATRARCAEKLAAFEAVEARFLAALEMGTDDAAAPPFDATLTALDGLVAVSSAASLVMLDGGIPRTFRLASRASSIGRGEGSDIRLVSPRVSQRHAVVHVEQTGYRLQDCDSANGTFVNGVRVSERMLEEGDRIRIGELELVFHAEPRH
jgi:hypothetical protein